MVAGSGNVTNNVNRQAFVNHANAVRAGYHHDNCFHDNWWPQYPNAWRAAAWGTAAAVFGWAPWRTAASYVGYPVAAEPAYYDYGSNVVYEGDTVYVNGDSVGTYLCADLQCSLYVRGKLVSDQGRMPESLTLEQQVARLTGNLATFLRRVRG